NAARRICRQCPYVSRRWRDLSHSGQGRCHSEPGCCQIGHSPSHDECRTSKTQPGNNRISFSARRGRPARARQCQQPVQGLARGGCPMIIAAVIFALLLGAFTFVVLPHASVTRRAISVSIFLALIVIVYGGAAELLGRPKPLRLEWRDSAKAQVLAAL